MKIADREIGGDNPPYIIAEISGNHCGKLENAIRLIKAARRAGADAVKTQCYEPDTITLNVKKPDFIAQSGHWKGRTLYELYGKAHTPFAWHKELFNVAKAEDITIFSSVFDFSSVDLLERLGCPAYKIASFEIVDIPLIRYASQTGKPLIISTGLATNGEILDASEAAGERAAFLHCTSEYPALVSRANLGRMRSLGFIASPCPIGISDHTLGIEVPVVATALGATIIEKHLKLETVNGQSEDEGFSMKPRDFSRMINSVHAVWEGLKPIEPETANRQFRRSLYVIRDIKKGDTYSLENIRSIRPGYGLPPKMLGNLLGKKSKRDWRRGDPLS